MAEPTELEPTELESHAPITEKRQDHSGTALKVTIAGLVVATISSLLMALGVIPPVMDWWGKPTIYFTADISTNEFRSPTGAGDYQSMTRVTLRNAGTLDAEKVRLFVDGQGQYETVWNTGEKDSGKFTKEIALNDVAIERQGTVYIWKDSQAVENGAIDLFWSSGKQRFYVSELQGPSPSASLSTILLSVFAGAFAVLASIAGSILYTGLWIWNRTSGKKATDNTLSE